MPKQPTKVNKSQAVRDVLAENPQMPTMEVVAGLAKKGMRVKPTLVYFVKGKLRHQKRKQQRQRAVVTSRAMGNANPADLVLRVKSLARDAGGLANLIKLVQALAE